MTYIVSGRLISFQQYCMKHNIVFARPIDSPKKLSGIGIVGEKDVLVILPGWEQTNISDKQLKAAEKRFRQINAEVKHETV